jgi:hypothetical protein
VTKSATEPLISVLFGHSSTESSVLEATYLGVRLIQLANGSSVEVGQYAAHFGVGHAAEQYGVLLFERA